MGADVGPAAAGVAHINEYGRRHFQGCLTCSWTELKGRVVHAARDFTQGDIILAEPPLHVVQEDGQAEAFKKVQQLCKQFEDDFDYEPLWYWCALRSLTDKQLEGSKAGGLKGVDPGVQKNLLLLHHEEPAAPSSAASILAKELAPGADAMLIERLIQIWVLNCFEYSDNPQGYSTYFFSSFMSHSCFPNAIWHYQDDDHVLRARRDIKVGDEVCISYLTEDGLLQCASMRRWDLHETKHFWCTCERCGGEKDFSRGFRCPKCEEGAIFSRTPAPGAASSAALQPEELVNESCSSCKFKVTKKEAERLTKLERTLRVSIDKYAEQKRADEAVALKSFRATEEIIDASFFQHALADLMWEKLADYYAQHQRSSDHRRLLERRCAFHEAAYPGLSAAHAWCLEGFADALKKEPSATQAPPVVTDAVARGSWAKADRLRWQKAAKAEPEEAARLYTQAHDILRLMFGESHEYVTGLESKRRRLSACGLV